MEPPLTFSRSKPTPSRLLNNTLFIANASLFFDQIEIIDALVEFIEELFHRGYQRFNVAPTLARSPGTAENLCDGFQLMLF